MATYDRLPHKKHSSSILHLRQNVPLNSFFFVKIEQILLLFEAIPLDLCPEKFPFRVINRATTILGTEKEIGTIPLLLVNLVTFAKGSRI